MERYIIYNVKQNSSHLKKQIEQRLIIRSNQVSFTNTETIIQAEC
jgi:hypothetical protein